MANRYVGLDLGAETIKVVEVAPGPEGPRCTRQALVEHHKEPAETLRRLLETWDWSGVAGAAATGRFRGLVNLPGIPVKHAQAEGFRRLHGNGPATVVSIGGHGFSVLELRAPGVEVFRENSRCSQGTGNFLRQLVARFDLTIERACELCENVPDPAPLSGRCPVILKTDMTHLANRGEGQERILAGLYDAVCENVQVLIKPGVSPPRVLLAGGVGRSRRIRENFRCWLARRGMELIDAPAEDSLYLEAFGCACEAATRAERPPPLDRVFAPPRELSLERLAPLRDSLPRVRRMQRNGPFEPNGDPVRLLLGFDIGSTGSKAVALDGDTCAIAWEGYVPTSGNPVQAAQALMRRFVDGPAGRRAVVAFGATGSGREIVGSLLASCYGVEAVYVLNEIAAHAEGALFYDERVDTIFEIGGQDAKYVRLAGGRVVDAAMNEACSAGTGSFIEEQGRKFSGIRDVVQLGEEALRARGGVSLGQHCSVFMAEVIDEAVAAGVDNRDIVAGIYDSIIRNYLNRVKGSRSVGQVIFCQGMPFSADALAAAVARQTGSEVIVPPSPGTVGALGIALLARKALAWDRAGAHDPRRFLEACVLGKDTFVCKSTRGCGGGGNHCRIDRISTRIGDQKSRFTWGGGCSLWDRGTGRTKLPDRAPDPFREREALIDRLVEELSPPRGNPTIALTDEFQLKGLFPFFATFVHELGFDPLVRRGADRAALKRGIERANVAFCAPMQQYHGLVGELAGGDADHVFLPMLREIPRVADEPFAAVCPIVQGSPDVVRWDLSDTLAGRVVSPRIDCGRENLESAEFLASCERTARELGVAGGRWKAAWSAAIAVQRRFEEQTRALGREAMAFCEEHGVLPVVVLGRPYTIYNPVLNSNVPALLREQGALAIPVDCYTVAPEVPVFREMYWAYGQRNLRAAWQIRRTPGHYALWCSNYSCGPDSFNLHFFRAVMEGKPFAVIETDGHSGDAGTKTRVEAFLHCVREDRAAAPRPPADALERAVAARQDMDSVLRERRRLLIPRMGEGAEALAACLRGVGIDAETLSRPDRDALRRGRRYTSGKECVPMCITLGSLLQRLEREPDPERRFAFFMPRHDGPCRFGCYNLLHKLTLDALGYGDRVGVWSPGDGHYFAGVPGGFTALVMAGFTAFDMLLEGLYDARPVETRPGAAERVYREYTAEVARRLEDAGRGDLSVPRALFETYTGRLFGLAPLLRRAAREYAAIRNGAVRPAVLVVGEIYVRCDPFANDSLVDKLEERGLRVRFSPFVEWLEYTDLLAHRNGDKPGFGGWLSSAVQRRIQERSYSIFSRALGWPARTTVRASLDAAAPYLREDLEGEAVLTIGGPVHEWREGVIDGAVSVGPLECMPTKLAQAQFFHVAEREGLPTLTLPVNGDPIDPELLENFAFEVERRFRHRTRT